MLRRIHLVFAAMAMILATAIIPSDMAMAHEGQAASAAVCHETASPDDSGMAGKSIPSKPGQCCVAMCAATTPLGSAVIAAPLYEPMALVAGRQTTIAPFTAELPTPPPRNA